MWCPRCNRTWDDEARFCPRDGSRLSSSPDVETLSALPSVQSGVLLGARYEVRGFIARGAMARVYLAQDLETQEPVAIKVLDVAAHRDREARERFLREASAAGRIDHPDIVKVLDTGERGDGAPYLVMEYLFGEALGSYLRREKGPVQPRKAVPRGVARRREDRRKAWRNRLRFKVFCGARSQTKTRDRRDRRDARRAGRRRGAPAWQISYLISIASSPTTSSSSASRASRTTSGCTAAILAAAMRKRPMNRHPSMDKLLADLETLRAQRGSPRFAHKPIVPPDAYEPQSPISAAILSQFQKLLDLRDARKGA